MDIPNTGAIFTLGKSHLAENTQSYFYIKNDPIKRLVSGPNQSAVICESGRLFVWGENQSGQLGIGGGGGGVQYNNNNNNNKNINQNNDDFIITKPTCVKSLKTLGLKVTDIAYGDEWSVILTHSNEVYFAGRSVFPIRANIKNNEATNENRPVMYKPLRLQQFDDCLSKNEDTENFITVLAGNEHFALLTSFGRLIAWGRNHHHQLGKLSNDTLLKPYEIVLDAPVQQYVCGPQSTLVLTKSGKLYLTGHLRECVFPQFTELQKNLSTTEQITFMHTSIASEIFIVTNAGTIYHSIESIRNKNLIFQRFYDYDTEENGPIWKFLKGSSFYSVLTKSQKFYTTFSESGHHLKTFREISKFKNLRLLDMAVGDRHILVHGIPRSSTLSASIGPSGEHRFVSQTFVLDNENNMYTTTNNMNETNDSIENRMRGLSQQNSIGRTKRNSMQDGGQQSNEMKIDRDAAFESKAKISQRDDQNNENDAKIQNKINNRKLVEPILSKVTSSSMEIKTTNESDDPIMIDSSSIIQLTEEKEKLNEKYLRPRTPYPESSNCSTPQTVKKTPLRNFSYEAAMDHDYIEHTSPALINSLENIPEYVAGEKVDQKPIVTLPVTPPIEEDEQLTIEINETTDAESNTKTINEIRFINNGVDVTANIDERSESQDRGGEYEEAEEENENSDIDELPVVAMKAFEDTTDIIDSVKRDTEDIVEAAEVQFDDLHKQAEGLVEKLEREIQEGLQKATRARNEMSGIVEVQQIDNELHVDTIQSEDVVDPLEEKSFTNAPPDATAIESEKISVFDEARNSMENTAKKTLAGVRVAVGNVNEKVSSTLYETRDSVEQAAKKTVEGVQNTVSMVEDSTQRVTRETVEKVGFSVAKVTDGAKNAVENMLYKMADGTKFAVDSVASKISGEMQDAKANLTSFLHNSKDTNSKSTVTANNGGDNIVTNPTTAETDERTTASVNSNQNSAGNTTHTNSNPFNNTNPFEDDDVEVSIEQAHQAFHHQKYAIENVPKHDEEQSKGKVRRFLNEICEKSRSISCNNDKTVRTADESMVTTNVNPNSSQVCSIL